MWLVYKMSLAFKGLIPHRSVIIIIIIIIIIYSPVIFVCNLYYFQWIHFVEDGCLTSSWWPLFKTYCYNNIKLDSLTSACMHSAVTSSTCIFNSIAILAIFLAQKFGFLDILKKNADSKKERGNYMYIWN